YRHWQLTGWPTRCTEPPPAADLSQRHVGSDISPTRALPCRLSSGEALHELARTRIAKPCRSSAACHRREPATRSQVSLLVSLSLLGKPEKVVSVSTGWPTSRSGDA